MVSEPRGNGGRPLSLTILALTLNEIDGVKAILPRIDRAWYDQLIVVDGGSTDGTIEWCRDHDYDVQVQQRRGIRFAYLRSEERRVGKECRSRWSRDHRKERKY